jgi:peptidylprolyl isomerase
MRLHRCLLAALLFAGISPGQRPDGIYAEVRTNKGLIVLRLDMERTPMAVANFVGLAEGTIANKAFDLGHPFFDGTVWHRVVPGHVIQTGQAKDGKSPGPGYQFPNEVVEGMSHNHIGAVNMANGGPNTNGSQWCIMLGDRSYLDGDFSVFGETMEGIDVVKSIVQGDTIETIRIVRVGAKAEAFHPTTESFQKMVAAAGERVKEFAAKKPVAEREWIARHYPKAKGPEGGVLSEQLAAGQDGAVKAVTYRGTEVRYVGDVIGHEGPAIDAIAFASDENGEPEYVNEPHVFAYDPGKTKINPAFDEAVASMKPGERRVIVVPAAKGYGSRGHYTPEVPLHRRFVISPNAMLVYEIEALKN